MTDDEHAELLDTIERQRERLDLLVGVLLDLGFADELSELLDA